VQRRSAHEIAGETVTCAGDRVAFDPSVFRPLSILLQPGCLGEIFKEDLCDRVGEAPEFVQQLQDAIQGAAIGAMAEGEIGEIETIPASWRQVNIRMEQILRTFDVSAEWKNHRKRT
jgi:hypothetical protein